MRRSAIPATLTLAVCCLALPGSPGARASDQIYKCVDPNGATVLSDKPCAVIQGMPADTAPAAPVAPAVVSQDTSAAVMTGIADPSAEVPRHIVAKEYYKLPPAEVDNGQWAKKPPVSTPPKIDVATLKAAKLKLELSDRTASLD